MTSSTRLVFTPDSQHDIDDIQQYTLQKWGAAQMEEYQTALYDAFERLRRFPELGRPLESGIREHALRHHVILYRYEDDTVTILRVMHSRRLRDR
jgi:plasmid stabilization system protein ParE